MKRGSALALALALSWSGAAHAETPTRERCAQAYESTQNLKRDGKLMEARKQAMICLDQACSPFVRNDCTAWFDEIERTLPTVIIAARDANGVALVGAGVKIDGAARTSLDGRPIPIDPGAHVFELEDARGRRTTVQAMVVASDRERAITGVFEADKPLVIERAPQRASWTMPIVFGSLSLVGLASFGVFGLLGKGAERDLERTCDTRCSDDQTAPVYRQYAVADVSLIVAILAAGAAVLTIPRQSSSASAQR